jgi:hypothetical protein
MEYMTIFMILGLVVFLSIFMVSSSLAKKEQGRFNVVKENIKNPFNAEEQLTMRLGLGDLFKKTPW